MEKLQSTPLPEPSSEKTEVIVDDSQTLPTYSNFCRITATTEEVLADFGLNPTPYSQDRQEIKAITRIVMNYYTAKRLLSALAMTIQRHEQTFGVIELDVRQRAGRAQTPSPPPPLKAEPVAIPGKYDSSWDG